MLKQHMLTTVDNPYSPETQWDEWFQYDTSHGYHTSALLARITVTSDELSERDQDLAREDAIDEIVRENTLGIFKKVAVKNTNSGE